MMSSSATLTSSFSSTSASSSPKFRSKLPSFSQLRSLLTVESRAKPFTGTAFSSTTIYNISGESCHYSFSRRRGLALTATLLFLLPLHEFVDCVGDVL